MGWPTGILVDGKQTTADAESNIMFVKNSIIAGASKKNLDTVSSNGTFNVETWFSNNDSRILSTAAEVMLTSPFDLNNPNALPLAGSPALTGAGTPPDDGFFDATANYVGAFKDVDWTFGWARFNPDSTTTGVKEIKNTRTLPVNFELSQNYPNPFNPTTRINYAITTSSQVTLKVYNILGQQVAVLVNGYKNAGNYQLTWDASNLPSGVYIYRIEAGAQVMSKKMTLLK